MRKINLKIPEYYVPVFERTRKELEKTEQKIIYIYSPPAYGKTTTLLKFFEDTNFNPLFIQIEERDRNLNIFKISLLEILSEFSETLKKTIPLMDEREISEIFFALVENEYKNIILPQNTYFVFLDTYHLMENFKIIVEEIILPVFKNLPCKVIIEANIPYGFKEDVKIIGPEFFTLSVEEIIELANFFGEKISPEDASLLKERTEGWVLPSILFFRDKSDTKIKLQNLLKSGEILKELLERVFRDLKEDEKINLFILGELREFDYEAMKRILREEHPEEIINKLKEKGIVLIEEIKNGTTTFRFHRLIKSYLEEKLRKFPMGYDLLFRIHYSALEYFDTIGDFENALYHAIKVRDSKRCGNYLKTIITELFLEGKISLIENFLREIESEGIEKTPEIVFCEGIYLSLIEEYKEANKVLTKIIKNLKREDYLIAKYFLLLGKSYLNENVDVLIEEGNKLLEEIKKYEEENKIKVDFEKDPFRLIKRKNYKSPDYFISLMYDRIYNFLGNRYHSKKEIEKAREFYEKSLFFAKKTGDNKRALIAINNIGITYLFKGEKEGFKYLLEVINYPGIFRAKAYSFYNLAVYYEVMEGDLEKAEENYKKAIEIYEKFRQKYDIINPIIGLLYIYLKKKDKGKIFEHLGKLEKAVFEVNNPRDVNLFYIYKTEIFLHLGELEEAEDSFRKINDVEIIKFEDDKYYKIYVEGKLKYIKGEIEEGKILINKSIEYSLKKESFIVKIEKLYYLYEIYKKFEDPEIGVIRKIAENLLREKGCLKRLKDFDIE